MALMKWAYKKKRQDWWVLIDTTGTHKKVNCDTLHEVKEWITYLEDEHEI